MAKKDDQMSTRCKIDTSREVRQWIGTISSVLYTGLLATKMIPGNKILNGVKGIILRR